MLHPIGSGVLGPVFRAFDPRQDRLVAVKTFKLDLLPEQVARLTDALRAMVNAPVAHPAVVPAIDAGLEGSTPYVVLTIALGETLDVTLRQLAPASPDVALPILSAVASAIDAVWDQGGSHGALHPRDVFVTPDGGDVRVTGFGIVRALEEVGAAAPARRPYASPERTANRSWDRRADVYALGAIAHELLTGRRPAGGGEQDGTFAASVTPAARVAIRRVLGAALADSPEARFPTLGACIAALEEATRGVMPSIPEFVAAPASASDAERPDAPDTEVTAADRARQIDQARLPVPAPAVHADVLEAAVALPPAGRLQDATVSHEPPASPEPIAPVTTADTRVSRETKAAPAIAADVMRVPARQWPDLGPVPEPLPVAASTPSVSPLPWVLVAAAAVAGLAVGLAGGYQVGLGRGAARAAATALAGAPDASSGKRLASAASAETAGVIAPATSAPNPQAPGTDTEVAIGAGSAPSAGRELLPPATPVRAPDVRQARAVAGRLTIRSTPARALVSVDGRHVGETPLTLGDLPLGGHVVQVARPGYAPHQQRVSLTSAVPAQTLVIALLPGLPTSGGSGTRGRLDVDAGLRSHVGRLAWLGNWPVTMRTVVEAGQPAGVWADQR